MLEEDRELLEAYLEGMLTPKEREDVCRRLREEPELAEELIVRSADQAQIGLWASIRGNPSEESSVEGVTAGPRVIRFPRLNRKALTGMAAVLAACLALPLIWSWRFGGSPMAMITGLDTVDKSWRHHQVFEPGDRIAIDSGFLELTYRNGVRLVLQGPSDYTLEEAGRGRLELGSLAADVPPGASGFTVVTPSAEVQDLGTRFAVGLLDTGRTEFEVFDGEVQARSTVRESVAKSWKTGETAAVDDGAVEVRAIQTSPVRFGGIHNALNRRTVEAKADRFVQGGRHADLVPGDGPDSLMLKQLGRNDKLSVARKVWIRFDLSHEPVNLQRPAKLTLHTAKAIKPITVDVKLHGLMGDYEPVQGRLDIDWRENKLTWNNAPGNDPASPVNMNSDAGLIVSGKIRVAPQTEPAGTYFTFVIPSLKPFLQQDGTLTLMLSTSTTRHDVLHLAAREHEDFPGPLLTFETKE